MHNIILIPYRKREKHLKYFIDNTIPLLKKHLENPKIIIIEQDNDKPFNRGILLNIGFNENLNYDNAIYFTHDVDINPYEETIIKYYKIADLPINVINGILTSDCDTLGGIISFKKDIFLKLNGFPNTYWGWGVEDKVLQNRAVFYGATIFKNIISKPETDYKLFMIFKDNHIKDTIDLDNKTIFEYNIYSQLSNEQKIIHNNNIGGISNLNYNVTLKSNISECIEHIKVNF